MATQTTNINDGVKVNTEKAALELFSGAGLVFGVINNHQATLTAQITDNFIENNTALQDHIAFQPITVTLSGIIGDIILTSEAASQQAQDELEQAKNRTRLSGNFFRLTNYSAMLTDTDTSSLVVTKLGTLGAIIPQMSNVTRMATGVTQYAYEAAANFLTDKWANQNDAILSGKASNGYQSIIKEAYEQLKNAFYSKSPNRVITPWATYENMYIQSIEISQDERNYIVDISVSLKQLRFSAVQYTEPNEQVLASYNYTESANEENCGKMQSTLYKMGDATARKFIGQGIQELMGQ